eukprot:CAMPEP_0184505292 /NCGR_PEP_ID=MMETSP0113_2-20130426/52912_1 /TAXON_ID=91329 /ORGANISM="Norrisiella sphaerica, Strain BC52" /LENGTH=332 /DNA_ID=CAMNT_0026894979 /DNA_START=38 /DNA_END=1033 /DNA_ORIENTATION=-
MADGEKRYSNVAWGLFFLTGTAPWMMVNALFLQLAAFTDGPNSFSVPEGNAIASHMALAIQVGNIVTILYVFMGRYILFDLRKVIMGILAFEVIASAALYFAWDHELVLFNLRMSHTLIITAFISGAAGSMSNVTFWSFATRYCPEMTAALALGTSFSNILPSVVAAIQMPGSSPVFSPSWFFLVIGIMLCMATLSFYLISWSTLADSAYDTGEVEAPLKEGRDRECAAKNTGASTGDDSRQKGSNVRRNNIHDNNNLNNARNNRLDPSGGAPKDNINSPNLNINISGPYEDGGVLGMRSRGTEGVGHSNGSNGGSNGLMIPLLPKRAATDW